MKNPVLSTVLILSITAVAFCAAAESPPPYILILGIAQDAGAPQAGSYDHPGWTDPAFKRHATSLALVDPADSRRWLIDCTPDFREQLQKLDAAVPPVGGTVLDGIFLTHAHMGHYTGLLHLGHEAMGARGVPVYVMPRMHAYLSSNGPWSQLVDYKNITLNTLEAGASVALNSRLSIEPFLVPHRQEFSEVVGYRIVGPNRSALFIPDIDKWEDWDQQGVRIEDVIAGVDVAYLDGTFFANGEIPGRDMSGFPHPFIRHSMERFDDLAVGEKKKIRFIHLNHTNPALLPDSEARREITSRGFAVAEEMERIDL